MKWKNLIKVAFKSILKNRMRSFLTILGIVIGVGAVIALVAIGQGASADIEGEISSLGTNMLIIRPGSIRTGGVSRGASSLNTLRMDDVKKLEEEATLLQYVSPIINAAGQVIAAGKNWSTSVQGVSTNYLEIRDWSLEKGTFFTDRDTRSRRKVAVLGKTVAEELFGEEDPIGAKIRIRNVPFKVIGVLSEKGQSGMGDQDDVILAPSTTVLYRMSDGRTVNTIMASAVSSGQMDAAQEDITRLIREEHKLKPGENDDFFIRSQTDIISRVTSVTGTLTMLLGAIAGVSLLVGGIGIMNIMLVSVTERTKEIGIRMAVGARGGDVLAQFLIEAIILSMLGGIIGILLGIGLGKLVSSLINSSLLVDPFIAFIAFIFSGAVGVFFGLFPARKASRLNPIDALHYE
jgi:putative ABC transport system permease protein